MYNHCTSTQAPNPPNIPNSKLNLISFLHNFFGCSLLVCIVLCQNVVRQLLMEEIGIRNAEVRNIVTTIAIVIVVIVATIVATSVATNAGTASCIATSVAACVATTTSRLRLTCNRARERERDSG